MPFIGKKPQKTVWDYKHKLLDLYIMKYKEYIMMKNPLIVDYNTVRIHITPVLESNYSYIIEGKDALLAIDPGESASFLALAKKLDKPISTVLITHGHLDHVAGLSDIVDVYCPKVYGPGGISTSIQQRVKGGDHVECLGEKVLVLSTPGHTSHCISYYFPDIPAVFVGDCLFVGGCGRVFDGNPQSLWQSIKKLRGLPPSTDLYVGHEYTLANYRFGLSIVDQDPSILKKEAEMVACIEEGGFSVPSKIEDELKTNIFMRCDSDEFAEILDCKGATAEAVFTKLRNLKDEF